MTLAKPRSGGAFHFRVLRSLMSSIEVAEVPEQRLTEPTPSR